MIAPLLILSIHSAAIPNFSASMSRGKMCGTVGRKRSRGGEVDGLDGGRPLGMTGVESVQSGEKEGVDRVGVLDRRVPWRIGLVSDTHGLFDPGIRCPPPS